MYSTMLYKAVFSFLISLDLLGFVPAPGTELKSSEFSGDFSFFSIFTENYLVWVSFSHLYSG